jgi:hypothetical protein
LWWSTSRNKAFVQRLHQWQAKLGLNRWNLKLHWPFYSGFCSRGQGLPQTDIKQPELARSHGNSLTAMGIEMAAGTQAN